MTNEYNPDGKEIRFIDSHYKDLFHIPDGSCVQIHYPDEMVVKPCTFIDEYHTQIGYNVFHMEAAFYSGRQATPEPVQPAATESSADDKELLLKLLQNPEMAALLKSLAKTL